MYQCALPGIAPLPAVREVPTGRVAVPASRVRPGPTSSSTVSGACASPPKSRSAACRTAPKPAVLGHPQYGLAKLLAKIGVVRVHVEEIGAPDDVRAVGKKVME